MPEELYADSITGIALTGSVVRIDFATLAVAEDANQQPRPVFRQRVIMPVEGFVHSFGVMARVMQQLEQKGLVRRADAPAAGKDAAPAEAPARTSSPNFKS